MYCSTVVDLVAEAESKGNKGGSRPCLVLSCLFGGPAVVAMGSQSYYAPALHMVLLGQSRRCVFPRVLRWIFVVVVVVQSPPGDARSWTGRLWTSWRH